MVLLKETMFLRVTLVGVLWKACQPNPAADKAPCPLRRRLEAAKAIKGIKMLAKIEKLQAQVPFPKNGNWNMSLAISVFSEITVCGWQVSLTEKFVEHESQ